MPGIMTKHHTDRAAWFEAEAGRLIPDLYGAALRLARNDADAQDLVADAVGNAWTHLASLQDQGAFRGWVFRILHNGFVSRRRSARARTTEEPYDEEGVDGFSLFERLHQPFLLWWGSNPEQEFLDKLFREDLERAVDALPDSFREVVILADLQGFSYREIADVLGIPIGTVRSRLARGRALLQRALWRHAVDAGLRSAGGPDGRGGNDGRD
jgi:RNA polymerase sigma-70 factor (ECF subfamily)